VKRIFVLLCVLSFICVTNVYAKDRVMTDFKLVPSVNEASVGEKIGFDVIAIYGGDNVIFNENDPYFREEIKLSDTDYTISNPHLLKPMTDGTIKILGVGSSEVTVRMGEVEKSVTITGSLDESIDGGYIEDGVSYLPIKKVIAALGGSMVYDAEQKGYRINVGQIAVTLPKKGTKASLNGKSLTLKAPLLIHKGTTLVPATLVKEAFGASLNYKSSEKKMRIAVGKGEMTVIMEQPKPKQTAPASGAGKLYAVPATGDMKGWSILKGHPYEKSVRIYFKFDGTITQVYIKDIREIDMNKKVTWTDLNGKKHTNTIRQLYSVFAQLSNQYTSDLLYKMFGDVYADWLAPPSMNAEKYVDQYLEQRGLL